MYFNNKDNVLESITFSCVNFLVFLLFMELRSSRIESK